MERPARKVRYVLTINVPPTIEWEPEDRAFVDDAREAHDPDDGLQRYLGDVVNDAEGDVSDLLPEGWSASVEFVDVLDT